MTKIFGENTGKKVGNKHQIIFFR